MPVLEKTIDLILNTLQNCAKYEKKTSFIWH